jgi:hypothetical protein
MIPAWILFSVKNRSGIFGWGGNELQYSIKGYSKRQWFEIPSGEMRKGRDGAESMAITGQKKAGNPAVANNRRLRSKARTIHCGEGGRDNFTKVKKEGGRDKRKNPHLPSRLGSKSLLLANLEHWKGEEEGRGSEQKLKKEAPFVWRWSLPEWDEMNECRRFRAIEGRIQIYLSLSRSLSLSVYRGAER